MKKKHTKGSRSVGDMPKTPVSSLSVVMSYLQTLAVAEQVAATYNGYEPPYAIQNTINGCTALINGLLIQYGSQMSSSVVGSLKSAITSLSSATTFEMINAALDAITISTDVPLYSGDQIASDLTLLVIQGVNSAGSVDALVSVILTNVPTNNVDGLSSGVPSILGSLFPLNYPDANDLTIFPQTDSNTKALTICLIYNWEKAGSPSDAGTWLVQGGASPVASMFLNTNMQALGSNPTAFQIQTLTLMINDLGNYLDTINKDVSYKLPDYGEAIAQFSQDLKYYDNKVITPITLQNDFQVLISSLQ